jgi:hypothetical protein
MRAAVAILMVCAGAAWAGPRESITFTNVTSDGMRNWVQNEFRACEFGGDYFATKVHISGTIRALAPQQTLLETQIAVGAPDWNIIWVYPFGDLADEYDVFTLAGNTFELESPVRAGGRWDFQFFETADDAAGPDAVWETVTITLDDDPPPPDTWYEYLKLDSGDTGPTAQVTRGHGPLREIRGFGSGSDADLFWVHIPDPTSFSIEVELLRYFGDGAVLALFKPDGTGVAWIDARTPMRPGLDNTQLQFAPGDYLLGIATAHRYPVDALGRRLWNEFENAVFLPNGPGAGSPVARWEGAGEPIQYHIRMQGVGYAGLPNTCTADIDQDGDAATDADIEAFFACLAGNCCTHCTPDFNDDGDAGTDADIEAFFRVLAGGAC